jgi:hypothetical protein
MRRQTTVSRSRRQEAKTETLDHTMTIRLYSTVIRYTIANTKYAYLRKQLDSRRHASLKLLPVWYHLLSDQTSRQNHPLRKHLYADEHFPRMSPKLRRDISALAPVWLWSNLLPESTNPA